MTGPVLFLVYLLTVLLAGLPLVHILMRGKLKTYFVYFVFGTGHLFLNVLGSISPNIRRNVPTADFHLVLLVSALAFFGVYLLLIALAAGYAASGRPVVLRIPDLQGAAVHRAYVRSLFGGACAAALLFYLVFAPPVILRFDLFGNWEGLIAERWNVVYGVSSFNWFSLAFFDIPLLCVLMAATLSRLYRDGGRDAESAYWARALRWMLPVAGFLAIGFLHIIVLVYLLAGVALVAVFFSGRVPLRLVLRFGAPTLAAIFLLYFAKKGFVLSGAFLAGVAATVGHRIFEINAWSAATTVWLFPNEIPFLQGRTFINFFGMFSYEQVDLASLLYPYIYNDISGGAPAPAIFESWANFGWTGALLTLAVLCVLAVGVTLMSWSRSVFVFALSVFLTLKSLMLWQSALWFGMMDPSLMMLMLALVAWYALLRGGQPRVAVLHPVGA